MPDTAIVTGAGWRAEGIGNGRAAAILLAREGAKVLPIDSVPERAQDTKDLVDGEGNTSMVAAADVTIAGMAGIRPCASTSSR